MAAKPAEVAEGAEAKPKSKKMLIIIVAAVLVLVLGAVAAFFLFKPAHEDEEGEDGAAVAEQSSSSKKKKPSKSDAPPEFMPLDAVVVNLADKEGIRYAQVGLTLQLEDAHTGETIKKYMPAIRNGILMAIARRNASELLTAEGKEALANDIAELVREQANLPLEHGSSPVQAVLFSSLIVQ